MGEKESLISRFFLVFISIFFIFNILADEAPAHSPKTLVLSVSGEPKSFNEMIAQETSTTQVTSLLFEGLTYLNTETGEVEGRLAEKWEMSPDGLTWIFFLRRDVQWFDGFPFTAQDVLFTFRDLIYNPRILVSARDIFTLEGKPVDVQAIDDYTVKFQLPTRFAPFLLAMTQSIFPEHVLKKAVTEGRFSSTWGTDTDPKQILGTGPFKLKRYLPGERIEFERNGHYWKKDHSGKPLPYLERIIFLIIPSSEGHLLKFLEGETDYYTLSGRDYPLLKPLEKKRNFSIYEVGAANGSNFLVFNQRAKDARKSSWFRSRNFRQAVALALDRTSMIDIVFNRLGIFQCSPLSPSAPFFFNSNVPCYEFDLEKAKTLLSQDGFQDRDGDGVLEDREGQPVEFVLLTNAESPERIEMAGMVREDLSKLGFKVHFLPVEFNTLVTKLVATHDWEAVLMGLTGEVDPHFGANVWKSSGSLHFWNAGSKEPLTKWETRVDEIFDRALRSFDRQERKGLYDEWQNTVTRELPLIYTVLPKTVYAVRNRFIHLKPTVLGGPFHNIEEIDTKDH